MFFRVFHFFKNPWSNNCIRQNFESQRFSKKIFWLYVIRILIEILIWNVISILTFIQQNKCWFTVKALSRFRSSRPEVFCKRGVLRNFEKIQFLKKSLWHRSFSENFAKFPRAPFLQTTSVGCFCRFNECKLDGCNNSIQWNRKAIVLVLINSTLKNVRISSVKAR